MKPRAELYLTTAEVEWNNTYATTDDISTTTEGNYTEDDDQDLSGENYLLILYFTLILFAMLLSFSTCVVASVSWLRIPQWRTFKNYVFLNLIFSYTASYTVLVAEVLDFSSHFMNYFLCSFSCWLFIASVVTYMDIVKVFSMAVTHRKIKSTLFGWGLPLLNILLNVVDNYYSISDVFKTENNVFYFMLVMLFSNFVMYLRVLYSLFRVIRIKRSRTKYLQKVQVATFTFFMSGSMMLPGLIACEFEFNSKYAVVLGMLPFVQTIVISTCFLLLKSNRNMWTELCCSNAENIRQRRFNTMSTSIRS